MAERTTKEMDRDEPTLEDVRNAQEVVLSTFDASVECCSREFTGYLYEQINALPRTQAVRESLRDLPRNQIPHALFKLLQKKADAPESEETRREDGVLIRSMQRGHLECAGRSMIASAILEGERIEHVVVNAPNHTFLLIEISPETLAYADFNQDRFFMFPTIALEGYTGPQTICECHLRPFQTRDNDIVDGEGFIYDYFISEPHRWGTAEQYLQNVKAALGGQPEFASRTVALGTNAVRRAMNVVMQEVLGEFPEVLQRYYRNMDAHATEVRRKKRAFLDQKNGRE